MDLHSSHNIRTIQSSSDFNQKILIIDDDVSLHELCLAALSRIGYQCVSAYNGEVGLAKILEEQGDKVTLLDFSAEKFEEHKLLSTLSSVDVVGISLVSTSVEKTNEIVRLIKEKDKEIPVVIGGPHCTLFPKKALQETHADISVQGDGEKVIGSGRQARDGGGVAGERHLPRIALGVEGVRRAAA